MNVGGAMSNPFYFSQIDKAPGIGPSNYEQSIGPFIRDAEQYLNAAGGNSELKISRLLRIDMAFKAIFGTVQADSRYSFWRNGQLRALASQTLRDPEFQPQYFNALELSQVSHLKYQFGATAQAIEEFRKDAQSGR